MSLLQAQPTTSHTTHETLHMVFCVISNTSPWRRDYIQCDFTGPVFCAWKRRVRFWALLLSSVLPSNVAHMITDHHCAGRVLSSVLMSYSLSQHVLRSSGLCPQHDSHSPLCAVSRECCEMPWPTALTDGDKYRSPIATGYHSLKCSDHSAAGSVSCLCVCF